MHTFRGYPDRIAPDMAGYPRISAFLCFSDIRRYPRRYPPRRICTYPDRVCGIRNGIRQVSDRYPRYPAGIRRYPACTNVCETVVKTEDSYCKKALIFENQKSTYFFCLFDRRETSRRKALQTKSTNSTHKALVHVPSRPFDVCFRSSLLLC